MAYALNNLSAATAWVASFGVHAPVTFAAPMMAHDATRDVLRDAQVALYCDHDHEAMHALRQARRLLNGADPRGQDAMRAVDEAAWHIRHHETAAAQSMLDLARDRLR